MTNLEIEQRNTNDDKIFVDKLMAELLIWISYTLIPGEIGPITYWLNHRTTKELCALLIEHKLSTLGVRCTLISRILQHYYPSRVHDYEPNVTSNHPITSNKRKKTVEMSIK